jgi:hypothetical protein
MPGPGNPVRRGAVTKQGTTYTSLGQVPAATTDVALISVTNRTANPVKFRGYVADTSWAAGEPVTTTIISAYAYDMVLAAGQTWQVSYIIGNAGDRWVVYSDTAAALDIFIDVVPYT